MYACGQLEHGSHVRMGKSIGPLLGKARCSRVRLCDLRRHVERLGAVDKLMLNNDTVTSTEIKCM